MHDIYLNFHTYFQGRSVSSSFLKELFGIEDNHRPNVPTFQLTSPLAGKIAAVIESIREKSPTKQKLVTIWSELSSQQSGHSIFFIFYFLYLNK